MTKRCHICGKPATRRVLMNGKNGYRTYPVCEKCPEKKKAKKETR